MIKVFQDFVFEFPVLPEHADFLPRLVPYDGVESSPILTSAEQIRIGVVGGVPFGKENLQNSINAVAGFDFEKWKQEHPLDYEFLKKYCGIGD